jgi:Xaa-Pro aminopeptidase
MRLIIFIHGKEKQAMTHIEQRLSALRQYMQIHKLDFYLVPSSDAHCNEYLPECWQRRAWISGFTGSAGEVLVSQTHAYLWTDGRYFIQAEREIDPKLYTLMRQEGFVAGTEQWLEDTAGKTLGVDAQVLGIHRLKNLKNIIAASGGKLAIIDTNLVDESRRQLGEKLELSHSNAFYLEERFSGESVGDKLNWLRSELKKLKVNSIALNALDEIAWLFNLRGADIAFNPLVISYAVISLGDAHLYVEKSKLSTQIKEVLNKNNVHIHPYEDFGNALSDLTGSILLDNKTASFWMHDKINKNAQIKLESSPITIKKACKNEIEIKGAKTAHLKDAVALINFFFWLNQNWKTSVDEMICGEKILEFRKQQENFVGPSFDTISGFAENSAVIHYRASSRTNKIVNNTNLYLLDSGGQFLEGTTDTTRTVHLGEATNEQKRHYTLVLKGHLALGRLVFRHGTCGEHMDILARQSLWNEFLDFQHGTGHGVGSFLCVHEGPQKISKATTNVPLLPGMIVSNEPGLYLKNKYGIRIENLCVVTEVGDAQARSSEYGPFYQFETLTMLPYCKSLIDVTLLTQEEILQISNYYQDIKNNIRHLLDEPVRQWLDQELEFV